MIGNAPIVQDFQTLAAHRAYAYPIKKEIKEMKMSIRQCFDQFSNFNTHIIMMWPVVENGKKKAGFSLVCNYLMPTYSTTWIGCCH